MLGVSPEQSGTWQKMTVMMKFFRDKLGKQGNIVYQHMALTCPQHLRVNNLSVSCWPDRKLPYWSPQWFSSMAVSPQDQQQQFFFQRYCREDCTGINLCMHLFVLAGRCNGNWEIGWTCCVIFPQTLSHGKWLLHVRSHSNWSENMMYSRCSSACL